MPGTWWVLKSIYWRNETQILISEYYKYDSRSIAIEQLEDGGKWTVLAGELRKSSRNRVIEFDPERCVGIWGWECEKCSEWEKQLVCEKMGRGKNMVYSPGVWQETRQGKGGGTQNTGNWKSLLESGTLPCRKWIPARDLQQAENMNRFLFWKDYFGSKMRLNVGGKTKTRCRLWQTLILEPSQYSVEGLGERGMSWWKVNVWSEPEGKVKNTYKLPILDSWETEALLPTTSISPLLPEETALLNTLSFSHPLPHFCFLHSTFHHLMICMYFFMICILH